MTVGDKIRYIRGLRNMTQKELGINSGFSSTTADVRIRQYESNKMIPKADKLADIANALQVDVSALSNINITSRKEAIQILFEFEKIWGISLTKEKNTFSITFDDLKNKDRVMFFFLDEWYEAKKKNILNTKNCDDYDNHLEYLLWKSRFPLDTEENENKISKELFNKFSPLKTDIEKEHTPLKTLKDFALLIEEMIRNNFIIDYIYLSSEKCNSDIGISLISFSDDMLLDLNLKSSIIYARFLYAIDTIRNTGIFIEEQKHTYEGKTFTDFQIYSASIYPLLTTLKELSSHILDGTEDDYIYEFKNILQQYNRDFCEIL